MSTKVFKNNGIVNKLNEINTLNVANYKNNSGISYNCSSFCLLHICVRR